MSTLTKRWQRLKQMSADEVRVRSRQALQKRWDLLLSRLGAGGGEEVAQELQGGRFFFGQEEVPARIEALRQRFPEVAGEIVRRAERICQHRFDLLGYEGLDYGEKIDWHLDVVHGKRAPRKPWFRVAYLDFQEVGDSKVTWELNRHQHLVVLAKAYLLSGEERFRKEIEEQWRDWQRENPYPIGINWASSLEVAFRTLSWIWVEQMLGDRLPPEFRREMCSALVRNGRHMANFLSTYFSPNTHLLGEAVALFILGTLYPSLAGARSWAKLGWKVTLDCAATQVHRDGFYFEQSTYYHTYALDFLLHARILAVANGMTVPAELDGTLVRMSEILAALGQAGPAPEFGDDDGGRLFDPQRNRGQHLLDPLSTSAVLFDRADFKAAVGSLTEETLWLLGPDAAQRFDALPQAVKSGSRVFAASGKFVMAAPGQELVVDFGPHGSLAGGHAHADGLSVALSAAGRSWLVDPGTCQYVGDGPERDQFRGTAAHNTLQVDGCDQAQPTRAFAWAEMPATSTTQAVVGECFDLFRGSHLGYRRLPQPVTHHRGVFYLKGKFWLVEDFAEGSGAHELALHWHLTAGVECSLVGKSAMAKAQDGSRLGLVTASDQSFEQTLESGWVSPAYGRKAPATVIRVRQQAQLPARLATLLLPGTGEPQNGDILAALDAGRGARGYTYRNREWQHWFFFSAGEGSWQVGEWKSDAAFVYCGVSQAGMRRTLVVCGGSRVDIGGTTLWANSQAVERYEWQGNREGGTGKGSAVRAADPTPEGWAEVEARMTSSREDRARS